jgi:hypothetical protein
MDELLTIDEAKAFLLRAETAVAYRFLARLADAGVNERDVIRP